MNHHIVLIMGEASLNSVSHLQGHFVANFAKCGGDGL